MLRSLNIFLILPKLSGKFQAKTSLLLGLSSLSHFVSQILNFNLTTLKSSAFCLRISSRKFETKMSFLLKGSGISNGKHLKGSLNISQFKM